jgi:hypothetical protein
MLVMERIRRRSRPDWFVCMVGWHKIFFHVVASGRSGKQIVWQSVLAEWGGCRFSSMCRLVLCSWKSRGVRSGDRGVPGPGGTHRWCGLDDGGALVGTGAKIELGGCDGLERAVGALGGLFGAVSGCPWGWSGVIQCYPVRRSPTMVRACWCSWSATEASVGQEVNMLGGTVVLVMEGLQMASPESA